MLIRLHRLDLLPHLGLRLHIPRLIRLPAHRLDQLVPPTRRALLGAEFHSGALEGGCLGRGGAECRGSGSRGGVVSVDGRRGGVAACHARVRVGGVSAAAAGAARGVGRLGALDPLLFSALVFELFRSTFEFFLGFGFLVL